MRATTLLATIWWAWGVVLILLLVVMSNLPLFGPDVRAAWDWFTPNLFPVMALVGGIQYQAQKGAGGAAGAAAGAATAQAQRKPSWLIALVLSVLYLLLLTAALVTALMSATPLEALRSSNLWLGPLLALNTAALGVVFAQG